MLVELYLQCFSVTVLISAIILLLLYLASLYVKSTTNFEEGDNFEHQMEQSFTSSEVEDLSYEEILVGETLTLSKYPDFPQASNVTIFNDVFCEDQTTILRKY
uniref:Uncharacterized protein n=1 Tax=Strongyloides venezuelensis TaxID=75913 RepID=A0A0K0F1S7_STRVS